MNKSVLNSWVWVIDTICSQDCFIRNRNGLLIYYVYYILYHLYKFISLPELKLRGQRGVSCWLQLCPGVTEWVPHTWTLLGLLETLTLLISSDVAGTTLVLLPIRHTAPVTTAPTSVPCHLPSWELPVTTPWWSPYQSDIFIYHLNNSRLLRFLFDEDWWISIWLSGLYFV